MTRNQHDMHEYQHVLRRRSADRERKRLVEERNRRMKGYSRTSAPHILARLLKSAKRRSKNV